MTFERLLTLCLLVIVIFMAPGCRREKKQLIVQHHDQSQLVRPLEAKFFDLYIPFGIVSRELLFESSDSSVVQLRYQVINSTEQLRSSYRANMDAHGWVLKADIDGNSKILFFKKPDATCVVSLQATGENRVCLDISVQKEKIE